jgi:hypothetical protein
MGENTGGGKFDLLFGPYQPPDLEPGDRTWCLLRDCQVVVTRWSDGKISWPLCHGLEANSGASGFLVDGEFARAIRSESAAAVGHWWGVGNAAVTRWRKRLGVGRMDAEGSRRLILCAIQSGIAANTDSVPTAGDGFLWIAEEKALLGVLSDAQVAEKTGRTLTAVRKMRLHLGHPSPTRPHVRCVRWSAEYDALALSLPVAEAAERTGHTPTAVRVRKKRLRRLRAAQRAVGRPCGGRTTRTAPSACPSP